MISRRNLAKLPDIDALRKLCQSLAMLDAILSPQWEFRYYSFNTHWSPGQEMASMRNGEGDDYFAVFNKHGAIIKGFAHESPISPYNRLRPGIQPGVLDSVPAIFASFLSEPAFSMEDTTFCIWRLYSDTSWQHGNLSYPPGPDPDGLEDLLSILDGKPATYKAWAEDYFEIEVSLSAVKHIYAHQPLAARLIHLLNEDITLEDLQEDIQEIGYPS
jgi:hypothetical protein